MANKTTNKKKNSKKKPAPRRPIRKSADVAGPVRISAMLYGNKDAARRSRSAHGMGTTMNSAKISNGAGSSEGAWLYSKVVKEHFFKPKNFMSDKEEEKYNYNALGMVGSPACGDMMKMWLYIDPKKEKIVSCRWRTFGCASAIASTSMLSVMITEKGGVPLARALAIKPKDILDRLGGLPSKKIHCSVLGDKALRAAVNDYFRRTKQFERITEEGSRMVDKDVHVTDKDIEQAVLDGVRTIEELQERTKIGTSDPSCLPEAEELLRFYTEKHFKAQ
jgi:NifU-like protein involved in Fe-S cluster formation/bacterioferritin-associated ferredoxin